jgi:uncharacterized protein YdhG (YjbR/CyaY superfamily)
MDKQMNDYLEKQKSPQKEIMQKVRKIFKKTLPNCEEKMRLLCVSFIFYSISYFVLCIV